MATHDSKKPQRLTLSFYTEPRNLRMFSWPLRWLLVLGGISAVSAIFILCLALYGAWTLFFPNMPNLQNSNQSTVAASPLCPTQPSTSPARVYEMAEEEAPAQVVPSASPLEESKLLALMAQNTLQNKSDPTKTQLSKPQPPPTQEAHVAPQTPKLTTEAPAKELRFALQNSRIESLSQRSLTVGAEIKNLTGVETSGKIWGIAIFKNEKGEETAATSTQNINSKDVENPSNYNSGIFFRAKTLTRKKLMFQRPALSPTLVRVVLAVQGADHSEEPAEIYELPAESLNSH